MLILDENFDLDEVSCQVILEYLYNIFGNLNYFIFCRENFSTSSGVMVGGSDDFNYNKLVELGFFDIEKPLFCMSEQLKFSQEVFNLRMSDNSNIPSTLIQKCICSLEVLMREGCKCRKQSSTNHQDQTSLIKLIEAKRKKILTNNFNLKYVILGKKELLEYRTSDLLKFHNHPTNIKSNNLYVYGTKILESEKESYCNFVITGG